MPGFRDRTHDFQSLAKTYSQTFSTPNNNAKPSNKSAFAQTAKEISTQIAQTSAKLQRLAKLAKVRSLFNDPVEEIQELTYVVKRDISELNKRLELLKTLPDNRSAQSSAHSGTVVATLSSRLQGTTSSFREVLEVRTENLKKQKEDREQFTGSSMSNSSLFSNSAASPLYNPGAALDTDSSGNPINSAANGVGGQQMQRQQQMQMRPYSYDSRLNAVETLESTVLELGTIMQELASMVDEQEHLVARIDDNVTNSLVNVTSAHQELWKVWRGVSGNRKLIIQMFLVFIVFAILFLVFFV